MGSIPVGVTILELEKILVLFYIVGIFSLKKRKAPYKINMGIVRNCLNEVNYNHERGVNRHTEDNSPKYRMVGKIISTLRSFAIAQDDVKNFSL